MNLVAYEQTRTDNPVGTGALSRCFESPQGAPEETERVFRAQASVAAHQPYFLSGSLAWPAGLGACGGGTGDRESAAPPESALVLYATGQGW